MVCLNQFASALISPWSGFRPLQTNFSQDCLAPSCILFNSDLCVGSMPSNTLDLLHLPPDPSSSEHPEQSWIHIGGMQKTLGDSCPFSSQHEHHRWNNHHSEAPFVAFTSHPLLSLHFSNLPWVCSSVSANKLCTSPLCSTHKQDRNAAHIAAGNQSSPWALVRLPLPVCAGVWLHTFSDCKLSESEWELCLRGTAGGDFTSEFKRGGGYYEGSRLINIGGLNACVCVCV